MQTSTSRNHFRANVIQALVILIVAQVLLGAVMHHHVLGDHGGEAAGAVHGDFTHEWHADQHDLVPDSLIPDTPTDLTPAAVTLVLLMVAVATLSRRLSRPCERHGGPSPPRYCLPQPRDPPHLRLT